MYVVKYKIIKAQYLQNLASMLMSSEQPQFPSYLLPQYSSLLFSSASLFFILRVMFYCVHNDVYSPLYKDFSSDYYKKQTNLIYKVFMSTVKTSIIRLQFLSFGSSTNKSKQLHTYHRRGQTASTISSFQRFGILFLLMFELFISCLQRHCSWYII